MKPSAAVVAAAATAAVDNKQRKKSKLKSRGGGGGVRSGGNNNNTSSTVGKRCEGTSVLEQVTCIANNDNTDDMVVEAGSKVPPVTPGGAGVTDGTIDLTITSPSATKQTCNNDDQFFSSPVVEIKGTNKTLLLSTTTTTTTIDANNGKRKRMSTSPSMNVMNDDTTAAGAASAANDVEKKKKKKTKKSMSPATAKAATKKTSSTVDNASEKDAPPTKKKAKESSSTTQAKTAAASTSPPPNNKKRKKKRSFNDQILYTMLTSNKPYTLKSLAKATNTTTEQLNHAMLSFIDKKLVIVKEFPSKKEGREGKKLYWATTVMLRDDTSDNGDGDNKKKEKKGSDGAIQKELVKLLATPREIKEAKMLYTKLEQQYKDIQKELQPLLAIPTMSQLDDDITSEEQKLKTVQDEIDKIRTRIREQSEGIQQQQSKKQVQPLPVTYGGYYRMQQQQRLAAAQSNNQKGPPSPFHLIGIQS